MSGKKRVILLADGQSFYASVEKATRPALRDLPVIVAGDPKRRSGIVLAACPLAKRYGVTTAETLGDALGKCPQAVVVQPHMQLYLDVSIQITEILRRFTDLVEPYSVDEQFVDLTPTLHLFGKPHDVARQIQSQILRETGIYSRIGISYCKVTAKMACDHFAKKNESGLFELEKERLSLDLWPLPVHKMFMVGSRMAGHLMRMGMRTIGDLAQTDLVRLRKRWGVNGELLWRIANGIDPSPVDPDTHNGQKGVGHQMTLPRDYRTRKDLYTVLLELCEMVGRRCRSKGYMGTVVSVGCRGADLENPSGFHRQTTLPEPTNVTRSLYDTSRQLLDLHWDGLPVRRVGMSLSALISDAEYQLSWFDPYSKWRQLERVTDQLKDKYGESIILHASSLDQAGQAKDRARKIGGHYK